MKLRAPIFVSAVALTAALLPSLVGLSPASADPLADPPGNFAPTFAFTSVCDRPQTTPAGIDACESAAVPVFDAARGSEGLAPIVLPDDYDALTVPEQLLAVINIERVDRGLQVAGGLSSALNQVAALGGAGVTTSTAQSALLAVFSWLYNDGTAWTDRHALLAPLGGPVAMGASYANGVPAFTLVGGDFTDTVDQAPSWAQIAATRTFGLDPASASIAVDIGATRSFPVAVTSAESALITVGMVKGAPAWSVSEPKTCQVVPGTLCLFTLNFTPPRPGRYPGVLVVSDGTYGKTLALSGDELAPQLLLSLGHTKVPTGGNVTVHGLVQDPQTGAALRGVDVSLQRKLAPGFPWQTLALTGSGALGKVTFHLNPVGTASYRLALIGPTGTIESKTPGQKVRVVS